MEASASKEAVIFYFSGTGNTWWVSGRIAESLNKAGLKTNAYSIEKVDEQTADLLVSSAGLVGFGYPIYGSDLPLSMKNFIASLPNIEAKFAFVFCTQFLWSGNGAAAGARLLEGKGFKVDWGEHFFMPNNLSAGFFPMPYTNNRSRIEKILKRAEKRIARFAEHIIEGEPFKRSFSYFANILGSLMRTPYQHFFQHLQNSIGIAWERCDNCGECVALCPSGNLCYKGDEIIIKGSCINCLRCYSFCPLKAMTYRGRPHPEGKKKPYKGPVDDFTPYVLTKKTAPKKC